MGFMWNKLWNWWRGEREWRRRVVPLAFWNAEGEWEVLECVDAGAEAALESVLAMAEWEALAARLGLSEEDKAIVRLLGEGYTQSEVAAQLGISQGRVGQRLARIRRLLGRNLGENSENSGGDP